MNASILNDTTTSSQVQLWEWFIRITLLIPMNVLYCIIIYVISKKSTDFNNSYFTLIKALAITNFLEILYDMHLFVYRLVGVYYLGEIFGKYFRLIALIYAWYTNMILHFFIGINRFCAVVCFQNYKQLFSKMITVAAVVISNTYGLLCTMPWVYYCGVTIKSKPNYNPAEYLLNCHPSVEFVYKTLDVCVGFTIFATVLFCYIVAGSISVQRLKFFVGSKASYIREIKMMGQGIFLLLFLGIVLLVYYAPLPGMRVNAELFQTFYCSINAIVYLMFDKKLRKHVRQLFICDPKRSNQVMPNGPT